MLAIREIALALEAAPAAVSAKAGDYVHDKDGYTKARASQNGCVCLVDHRIPNAVEPQCMDAEGVKTFLPKYLLVASLRAKASRAGDSPGVKAAFASGKLKAPKRPGIIYMLSPHNVVTIDEVKGVAVPFPGHLMFYAPNMTSADVGSDGTPASPRLRRRREDAARPHHRGGSGRRPGRRRPRSSESLKSGGRRTLAAGRIPVASGR